MSSLIPGALALLCMAMFEDDPGPVAPLIARDAADWEEQRRQIILGLEQVMGTLPDGSRRIPLDVREIERVKEARYTRIKLTYASEPGDRVPAWLLIPDGLTAGDRRPAILALHQTVAIGKDEPIGRGVKPDLHYGKELAERGYVVLAPDYPRFGEHDVDPYALGYASASMKAIWDNIRGVDLLVGRPDVDPGRIGVVGHSLGGHNAIFTAVFDRRIKATASSCGFTRFARYKGGDLTGWSHDGYMPRIRTRFGRDPGKMPFDFPRLIAAIAPGGFFACAPTRDDNFDRRGVEECIEAARPIFALLGAEDRLVARYPEAAHTFSAEAREACYGFFDRLLDHRTIDVPRHP